MAQPNLTEAQRKVMKWLGYGWETQPGAGSSIFVNGQKICNINTMKALERAGYVQSDDKHCWRATTSGKSVTGTHCL